MGLFDETFFTSPDMFIPAFAAYMEPVGKNAPPNQKAIATLTAALGDDDFKTREDAEAQLIKIGVPAVPSLSAVLRTSDDNEVTSRAARIVSQVLGIEITRYSQKDQLHNPGDQIRWLQYFRSRKDKITQVSALRDVLQILSSGDPSSEVTKEATLTYWEFE